MNKLLLLNDNIYLLLCNFWSDLGSLGSFIGGIAACFGIRYAFKSVNILNNTLIAQNKSIEAVYNTNKFLILENYINTFEKETETLDSLNNEINKIIAENSNPNLTIPIFISPHIINKILVITNRLNRNLVESISLRSKDSYPFDSLNNLILNTKFVSIVSAIRLSLLENENISPLTQIEENRIVENINFIISNVENSI